MQVTIRYPIKFAKINTPLEIKETTLDFDFDIVENYLKPLVETLRIQRVKNYRLARAGRSYDGGYILIDHFETRRGGAYSFGINDDVSWDNDVANCGYQIFMYDMTIDDLPKHRPEFHFFKEGIGREKDPIQKLDTLENFIERNGHQNSRNMILKMDVEGAEWDFLETVKLETLAQFDQVVIEFHNMISNLTLKRAQTIISRLQKINQTHQVVHLHANNNGHSIVFNEEYYPEYLEVTYANRENYEFEDAEIILPNLTFDRVNNIWFPEVILGNWNSRFKNS